MGTLTEVLDLGTKTLLLLWFGMFMLWLFFVLSLFKPFLWVMIALFTGLLAMCSYALYMSYEGDKKRGKK